ncbi:MAG: 50S ribosomal protein L10, partial [Planctomycetota bacterium JB042]
LARIAAKNLGYEGAEEVLAGPTAICYGGDSVATVARKVRDFAKGKPSPKVRGGLLDKKAIGIDQVDTLANLPTREELLAQVIGTIIAPATQTLGAIDALLTAIPGLTKALEEKIGEGGEG